MMTEGLILESILREINSNVMRAEIEDKPMSSILEALAYAKLKYTDKLDLICNVEEEVKLIGDSNIRELKDRNFDFSTLYKNLKEIIN